MARAGEHDLEQDDGHAPAGVFSFRFFAKLGKARLFIKVLSGSHVALGWSLAFRSWVVARRKFRRASRAGGQTQTPPTIHVYLCHLLLSFNMTTM